MQRKKNIKWDLGTVTAFYAEHGCTFLGTEYRTVLDKYSFRCHCGREHENSFESFRKHRKRCKACANEESSERRRLSKTNIIKGLEEKGLAYIDHRWSQEGSIDKKYLMVDYVCTTGHLNLNKYYSASVIPGKFSGCTECQYNSLADIKKLSIEEVREQLTIKNMDLLSKTYTNNITPIRVRCSCGNEWETIYQSIQNGNKCGCGVAEANNKRRSLLKDKEKNNNQHGRRTLRYTSWVRDTFVRDNFTCTKCDAYGERIEAHHIYSYAKYTEKRYDLDNGSTLCIPCHKTFHQTYGYHDFTPEDYTEYLGK